MATIYKIQNPIGEIYIGQSQNFKQRISQHKKNPQATTNIGKSILLYGFGNHTVEILQSFEENVSKQNLHNLERFYISKYKKLGFKLLNQNSGGGGGVLTTEQVIQIRKNYGPLDTLNGVAKQYNVSRNTVAKVLQYWTYTSIK